MNRLAFFTLVILASGVLAIAMETAPDGFLDIKWETDRAEVISMLDAKGIKHTKPLQGYNRDFPTTVSAPYKEAMLKNLKVWEVPVAGVIAQDGLLYFNDQGKFFKGVMSLPAKDEPSTSSLYQQIKDAIHKKYIVAPKESKHVSGNKGKRDWMDMWLLGKEPHVVQITLSHTGDHMTLTYEAQWASQAAAQPPVSNTSQSGL